MSTINRERVSSDKKKDVTNDSKSVDLMPFIKEFYNMSGAGKYNLFAFISNNYKTILSPDFLKKVDKDCILYFDIGAEAYENDGIDDYAGYCSDEDYLEDCVVDDDEELNSILQKEYDDCLSKLVQRYGHDGVSFIAGCLKEMKAKEKEQSIVYDLCSELERIYNKFPKIKPVEISVNGYLKPKTLSFDHKLELQVKDFPEFKSVMISNEGKYIKNVFFALNDGTLCLANRFTSKQVASVVNSVKKVLENKSRNQIKQ